MAVYTELEFSEIEALIAPLGLGRLTVARGIAAGVENTTYFLDFVRDDFAPRDLPNGSRGSRGSPSSDAHVAEYVLTIAETLSHGDLEFIAALTHDLNKRGLPVPAPAFTGTQFSASAAVLAVRGKPALVVPRIAGTHPQAASPELCREVGRVLAELHLNTLALGYRYESHRNLNWVAATSQTLLPLLEDADRELLHRELAHLAEFVSADSELPQAIIHGDLFRDNVLIENGKITALIDFFSAGSGYLLFDLAVVVNDWCFDDAGNFLETHYDALTGAYCALRRPDCKEMASWTSLLRIAALRFWVSRLAEKWLAGTHAPAGRGKDSVPYRRLLVHHRDTPTLLSAPF